jgi:hypothetical protein
LSFYHLGAAANMHFRTVGGAPMIPHLVHAIRDVIRPAIGAHENLTKPAGGGQARWTSLLGFVGREREQGRRLEHWATEVVED